ncbi:MAG TPA: hypothetical protein VE783_10025, partial [Candidatus Limnocylindrales bacterium]|nr:hypothetical protein [Candidatus Limnocylindrales bacterium]
VPALILLAAQGAVALSRLWPAGLYLSAMLLVWTFAASIYATHAYVTASACADWKPATQLVLAHFQPEDAICFAGTGAEPFLYYMREEKHMPWGALPNVHYSQGARCFGAAPENVAKASSPYRRAWLLKTDATREQYAWISRLLSARFGPASSQGSFGCPPGKIGVELLP